MTEESFTIVPIAYVVDRRVDPTDLHLGARRPRDSSDWPEVGTYGHRNMRRVRWPSVFRCRLLEVDGLDLHVEDLDAVDGTPVFDIKLWSKLTTGHPRRRPYGPNAATLVSSRSPTAAAAKLACPDAA